MTGPAPNWSGTSSDPNDEQFGHVVEQAAIDEAAEYDAVLVGEPYDGAVIGRPGARDGPTAIRDALAGVKSHHFDAGPVSSVGDVGDVKLARGSVRDVQDSLRETTAELYDSGAFPVFLGGDNSLTYPNVAPLLGGNRDSESDTGNGDSVGVVSFDAHLDCREVREGPSSGTPYRQLHEAGLDTLAVVGARHFETSTAYADYLDEQGGTVVTAESVGDGVDSALDRIRTALSDVDTVYVSVDMDVLDATAAPGVSAPTPGGLTSRELFRLVRSIAGDDRIAGFEVVECAPSLDSTPTGRTAATAARTVAHFLGGMST
ncbi:formiminoglutamase [Halogeometricum borinquense DSM 11551]|uniref:Formimidoylglutamase n=1 Tax=Halogeometricum borinquense (strain ATCC 700274 / DSM 11551 / JCM 10706 / KCTC 4070 / PR3) TaxID=469382 RepID=E4NT42_HALBP|nr:formimidoylglutamase [Halogeometricum borinquense]ADQ67035.1 formiminoglutamase [Halogeometricum borinquense DSM 11551]ELY29826.1 formiminoglutamase [Halogeometricum borinquense DSM 11551]